MDAPRIQYAKTTDGVRIAFWTMGDGKPLVYATSPPFNHLQMEWQVPELRLLYEHLARDRMLVKYDNRGCGLSQRDVHDYSLDCLVRDLEAVVDSLQLQSVDLLGAVHGGPVAITYAARNPQRVTRLILWCTYASSYIRSERSEAIRELLERDWELYAETAARYQVGSPAAEEFSRRMAELIKESTTPQATRAINAARLQFDVTPLLRDLKMPALILHRRQVRYPIELAKLLAAEIPDARLAVLEGDSSAMAVGDMNSVVQAIDEFLSGVATAEERSKVPSGTAIILFADIADSTALTERLGDAAFRDKARDLDSALRAVIREHAGTPIEGKLLGDGVLAVFTSARQAIEAALACGAVGGHAGLPLHLGLHAGDVIREENNVYGGAVNIASRIAGLSVAGEVLVSETVRSLARTSAGVRFEDRGEQALKGVGEPVRVWAVRSPLHPSPAPQAPSGEGSPRSGGGEGA